MTDRLQELSEAGVSIWLDDLSRERTRDRQPRRPGQERPRRRRHHEPVDLRRRRCANGERYDEQVRELAADGADVDQAVFALITTDDVRNACDVLRPVYDATDGVDGRVSIEVAPGLAHDTDADRRRGRGAVGRPSTGRTCSSRSRPPPRAARRSPTTLAEGISVNVTLIFGLDRYRRRDGRLPHRPREGPGERPRPVQDPLGRVVLRLAASTPRSTSGSRHDVRPRRPTRRSGKAGVANARLAYEAYEEIFAGERWAGARGRRRQRRSGRCGPRPASRTPTTTTRCTSTTWWSSDTVNTMPEKTLRRRRRPRRDQG